MTRPIDFLTEENARTIAELISDPDTLPSLRVKLIQKLLETTRSDNFFKTIFDHKMSFGKCPNCDHESHWLVPEVELNKMGWATHEKDKRVPQFTDSKICALWEQACRKKKINV